PLVDFAAFTTPGAADRAATATSIRRAFEDVGFLYLRNHGVPASVLAATAAQARAFFALPLETKQDLRWAGHGSRLAFIGIAGQANDPTKPSDLMEAYTFGHPAGERPTPWPPDRPGFRAAMVAYHDACSRSCRQLMRAIALGFGLP